MSDVDLIELLTAVLIASGDKSPDGSSTAVAGVVDVDNGLLRNAVYCVLVTTK